MGNISVCMVGHQPTHYERKVPTIGEFCQRLESRLFKTYNTREAFKTSPIAKVINVSNQAFQPSSIDFLLLEGFSKFPNFLYRKTFI